MSGPPRPTSKSSESSTAETGCCQHSKYTRSNVEPIGLELEFLVGLEGQSVAAEVKGSRNDIEIDASAVNDGILDGEAVVRRARRSDNVDPRAAHVFAVQALVLIVIIIGWHAAHLVANAGEVLSIIGGGA